MSRVIWAEYEGVTFYKKTEYKITHVLIGKNREGEWLALAWEKSYYQALSRKSHFKRMTDKEIIKVEGEL